MTLKRILKQIYRFPVVALIVATTGCGMLLSGCDDRPIPAYSEFVDIDPIGWGSGNPAELNPWPRDSVRGKERFSLEMAVRYTSTAPDTLRLALTTEAFDLPASNDTLTLLLRRSESRPVGKGSFGIYTVGLPLPLGDTVPEGLRIAADPLDKVRGILSVGLILKPKT